MDKFNRGLYTKRSCTATPNPTIDYLFPVPLHSEPPLRYDSSPPLLAHASLRSEYLIDKRTAAGFRLRFVPPLRSAPLPTIAVVIVFLLCGANKGTKIKDRLWYGVSARVEGLLRHNGADNTILQRHLSCVKVKTVKTFFTTYESH